MAKVITFTMAVIYDEDDTYGGNALAAIEHALGNEEGIREWESIVLAEEDVEDAMKRLDQ